MQVIVSFFTLDHKVFEHIITKVNSGKIIFEIHKIFLTLVTEKLWLYLDFPLQETLSRSVL